MRIRPSPPVAYAANVMDAMVLIVSKVSLMWLGGWHYTLGAVVEYDADAS
jgi:hypothetical protein